ncbi:integral membrane sensor signal transduction histidine kinase [Candidatus Omnitrophus magneticus]|uniref:histidine kinase n=1 Tax=Candidatus Omnitrophus magneticus TaxID=1609969 RepID=A0A0F0CS62_9BACT|nr:integral membrane sensor signal transduction histidine kinase [Candidatus Omnitrophus magneticus]
MKKITLKVSILRAFLFIIVVVGLFTAVLGFNVVNKHIIQGAQKQVYNDLKAARLILNGEIDNIKMFIDIINEPEDLEKLKKEIGLDYLYYVPAEGSDDGRFVLTKIIEKGLSVSGIRIIGPKELKDMGEDKYQKAKIDILETPKAIPTNRKVLDSAMAIEAVRPFYNSEGKINGVLYGGKLINREYVLVDKIRDMVFDDKFYRSNPVGTVTIFQDDVRINTNVPDKKGARAIGTRVSKLVYEKVVERGESWIDRAFVVTDWYLTAYEPIRDIHGDIVGILYVGILEKPFREISRNIFLAFAIIFFMGGVLAFLISVKLAGAITKPMANLIEGIEKISSGELGYRVNSKTPICEIDKLAVDFNSMAINLDKGYKDLNDSNKKLFELNNSYLDLVGFVSHELKGILSSTILNAYGVRDGFLGFVNFKQQRALDSIARNLDYFESTVHNFLSLSRIEKGEMCFNRETLKLREELIDVSVDTFLKQINEKELTVSLDVDSVLTVEGDRSYLMIVFNNLLGNAVKYTEKGGKIIFSAKDNNESEVYVNVYNDGVPITEEQKKCLFKKFSRLDTPITKKEKGTGMGLFISQKIVESYGGKISVIAEEKGNNFEFSLKKGINNANAIR